MSTELLPINVPGDGQPAFTLMERMAQAEATLKQLQADAQAMVHEAELQRAQLVRLTHAINGLAQAVQVMQAAEMQRQGLGDRIIYPS